MALTLEQLQAQRDDIVRSIGIARQQFGERSIEYSRAQDALAAIDAEIARVQGARTTKCTYGEVRKG